MVRFLLNDSFQFKSEEKKLSDIEHKIFPELQGIKRTWAYFSSIKIILQDIQQMLMAGQQIYIVSGRSRDSMPFEESFVLDAQMRTLVYVDIDKQSHDYSEKFEGVYDFLKEHHTIDNHGLNTNKFVTINGLHFPSSAIPIDLNMAIDILGESPPGLNLLATDDVEQREHFQIMLLERFECLKPSLVKLYDFMMSPVLVVDNIAQRDAFYREHLKTLDYYMPSNLDEFPFSFFSAQDRPTRTELLKEINAQVTVFSKAENGAHQLYQQDDKAIFLEEARNELRITKRDKRIYTIVLLQSTGIDIPSAYVTLTDNELLDLGGTVPHNAIEQATGNTIALMAMLYNNKKLLNYLKANHQILNFELLNKKGISAMLYEQAGYPSFEKNTMFVKAITRDMSDARFKINEMDAAGELLRSKELLLLNYSEDWSQANRQLAIVQRENTSYNAMIEWFDRIFAMRSTFRQRGEDVVEYKQVIDEALDDPIASELYHKIQRKIQTSKTGFFENNTLHHMMKDLLDKIKINAILYQELQPVAPKLLEAYLHRKAHGDMSSLITALNDQKAQTIISERNTANQFALIQSQHARDMAKIQADREQEMAKMQADRELDMAKMQANHEQDIKQLKSENEMISKKMNDFMDLFKQQPSVRQPDEIPRPAQPILDLGRDERSLSSTHAAFFSAEVKQGGDEELDLFKTNTSNLDCTDHLGQHDVRQINGI